MTSDRHIAVQQEKAEWDLRQLSNKTIAFVQDTFPPVLAKVIRDELMFRNSCKWMGDKRQLRDLIADITLVAEKLRQGENDARQASVTETKAVS